MVCIGRLCAGALQTKAMHKTKKSARYFFIYILTFPLPNDSESKLNLARRSLRRRDEAESGNRLTDRADCLERSAALVCSQLRRLKVGAIQDVEKLCAELNVEALGNFWN